MKTIRAVVMVLLCLALVFTLAGCDILKDNVAPSTPIITKTTPDNDNTPTFEWSATDEGTGIDFYLLKIDSWLWTAVGDATTHTLNAALSDGSHTLRVRALDNAGNVSEGSLTFICDTTPPTISSIGVSDITTSSATITWTTSDAATSQVDYGTTVSSSSSVDLDASLVTTHTVSLTELSSGTIYYYRVKSKDSCGNEATATYSTFITGLQQNLAVGQTAQSASKRVTAKSAARVDRYDTAYPASGNVFIIIDVLIENTGSEGFYADKNSFRISDSEGYVYEGGNASHLYSTLQLVWLYPNQKEGGLVFFEVPIGATGLTLECFFYDAGDAMPATWVLAV